MLPVSAIPSGNRCGHDPANPRLNPLEPIKSGPGCPPRILSLAAERAKEWFFSPGKCPLFRPYSERQLRSERREAIQVVLEFLLSRLDLASLCIGTPTLKDGFIDLDMKTIVLGTGLGQRRCERAIASLKKLGLIEVYPPHQHGLGSDSVKYSRARAVRAISPTFFEYLKQIGYGGQDEAQANPVLVINEDMD